MINDDDLFVVIVGDDCESESEYEAGSIAVKQEIIDEDSIRVEHLLDTATEYGQILHLNQQIDNVIDEDMVLIKTEYGTAYSPKLESDEDFVCDDEEQTSEDEGNEKVKETITRKRQKNLKKKNDKFIYWRGVEREIVSYINQLRDQTPEFQENEELLINHLAKKMKQTHRPDPPSNYYVTDGRLFMCVFCNVETSTEPAAHRHYQEKHGERYLYCYACGANFRSTTNLYKHEKKNCPAPDIDIVLKARARTLGRKGRSRPFIPDFTNEPPKKFNCTECSASFLNKNSLEPHLRMHRGERPFLCPHCPRAYTSAVVLSHHMRKHSPKDYICDHCRRSFKEKGKLVVHMGTHAPLRKYPCKECPKRYSTKADLVIHVNRDHRKLPLPFACKICPRRFARMSVFKIHMKKAHGMVIMTSNMFYRHLPEMTDTQLQQAMVVLKNQDFGASLVKAKLENSSEDES